MAAYHVVLVHFPIALWMTATLAILIRAFSDGPLAKAIDRALVPLLTLGLIMGVAAYVVGLMVWPWEAISATPLGSRFNSTSGRCPFATRRGKTSIPPLRML